ncbi:MAG TPA: hypothetical protein DFS52_06050 [Myxococcales bacterium]|jgi:hypothetical protein|nr:hypothetical protein [Myxococcales bacterium]
MHAYAAVLKLRPANVANRISGSLACILNGYDVQRAVAEGAGAIVVFELPVPRVLAAGVLRAARHLEAAIGLSAPTFPRGEGARPHAWFRDVLGAAEEMGYRLPMFLRAGPVAIPEMEPAAVEEARRQVFEHVDAGFTEVALDLRELDPAEGAAVIEEIAAPARERELSVEVIAPEPTLDSLSELAGSLLVQGTHAQVICLPPGAEEESDLQEMAEAAAPAVFGLSEPLASQLASAAVRRVSVARPFQALIEAALPAGLRAEVEAWRGETGADLRRALGHFHRQLEGLDEPAQIRLEALAYHEAREVLEAARARGTGRLAAQFLGERSGY